MRRNLMFRIMLAVAALAIPAAASANVPAVYLQGESAHVVYGDLNLHSDGDRHRLAGRIRRAAQLLCDAPDPDPLLPEPGHGHCFRVAVADGLAQMNAIAGR
jgi:UrcA family protein